MIADSDPSLIIGMYCSPENKQLLYSRLKDMGVAFRELNFIDVSIPPSRKDEIVNFFKHFMLNEYWADRSPCNKEGFFINQALKAIEEAIKYKRIKFKRGDWQPDLKHELTGTLAVPLFYQDTSNRADTKEEAQAVHDLATFKSEGYEQKKNILVMDE